MSQPTNPAHTPANSAVRNTASKESKQTLDSNSGVSLRISFGKSVKNTTIKSCQSWQRKKKRLKKRRQSPVTASRGTRASQTASVFSRLRRERDKPTRRRSPVSATVFTRIGPRDKNVFKRLGERKRDIHSRLRPDNASRHGHANRKRSTIWSAETPSQRRRDARELIRSYVTCSSKRQQEIKEEWNIADRESRMSYTQSKELYDSESDHDLGGHWKSKKHKSNDEDDLSQPWLCDKTDPFTTRIRNFEVLKRTRMPVNVKAYDGIGDPDDHLKIFQAAAKIERWAMPTWCHMFNSTLIGSARVWFDKLPSKSIDNYEKLQKTFLWNYSQ
ncbi:hypothetical protein Tco_1436832 [Tanacetum coccineum]